MSSRGMTMAKDNQPHMIDDDDDLKYMERSTLYTFVDESQRAVLLTLWQMQETADNNAFMATFVDSVLSEDGEDDDG